LARLRAALANPAPLSHVASCPACQEYFAANAELDQQLTMQARHRPEAVPAGLDDRIFQALQPTLRQNRRRRAPRTWLAVGLAGVTAVVALVMVQSRPAAPAAGPAVASVEQPLAPENSATPEPVLVDQWSDRLWGALAADASETAPENPLRRELAAVQADTRSALRFLARNFLPESSLGTNGESARSSS
jgi:hypothetical protein